jgi:uncharacterized protein (TIGR03000 family)
MPNNLNVGRFRFVWVVFLLAAAPATAQDDAQRATLRVRLPADARLVISGKATKQTGDMRRFYSPPLEVGKSYQYTLEWIYEKDGRLVKRKKIVHVRAGDNKSVDLRGEEESDKKEALRQPDVEYVPTPQEVVEKMLELAAVKKDDVVYDLGCGDGRIVVAAAKKYGCKAVGFDIVPQRLKEAKDNVKTNGVGNLVTIEDKNLFQVDLSPASVVTLYLLPDLNVKLIPQLQKLKAGSRIVSHDFPIEGVKSKRQMSLMDKQGHKHTLYLWEAPLKKE